ncbi:oxidoreductase [Ruegeria sp. SCPT10]|uniref:oxidoreductase n=1 Tax=Ruegeria sp. SCP10 TaxID=3141377 RepID=UPI0033356A3E
MTTKKQKSWFITGVSTGFGRELMKAALDRGDSVLGTVRNARQAEEIEATVPMRAQAEILDVTDESAVRHAVDRTVSCFGGIDVVMNNAGYGLMGAIEETSAAEVERQFATNVFGPLHVMRAAMPHFRAQMGGHVLNITSIGGLVGYPGWGIYNGTKFALEGLSAGLAKEAAAFGVKVTAVEPSAFRTDWAGRSLKHSSKAIEAYDHNTPRNWIDDLNGNQNGDPVRAAQAMLAIVDMDEPPKQLLLGSAALEEAAGTYEAALSQFREHAELTNSADFPES